jgi:hypothetical protein
MAAIVKGFDRFADATADRAMRDHTEPLAVVCFEENRSPNLYTFVLLQLR